MPKRWWWVLALVGLLTCGNAAAVAPLLISLAPALSAEDDTMLYKVVKNDEDQYGIWPADRENALGWTDAGKTCTKAECVAWIGEVWTDMRPESLRKAMESSGATSQPAAAPTSPPAAPAAPDESTAAQAPAAEPAAAEEEEEEEAAAPEESAPEDAAPSDEESFADDEAPADAEDAAEDATDATEEAGCVDEYGEPVEGPCE